MGIIETINGIFAPVDFLIGIAFFFSPLTLRMFTLSMATITIGAILTIKNKGIHKVLKYSIYIFMLVYSVYTFGVFSQMSSVSLLDFTAITFSIIAPICMIFVGKKVLSIKVKGKYKVFNLYTLWLIYILISILYAFYYPGLTINVREFMLWFNLTYGFASMFFLWTCNYLANGG